MTRRRFRFPWRPRQRIAVEVDDELAFHLEARTAEYQRLGLTAERAAARARQEFGDLERARRYCLEQDLASERRLRWTDRLSDLASDLRIAARRVRRHPALLALSVGTLAVGIAAATAFWTVVHQLVLNPFPFSGGDRAVAVYHSLEKSDVRLTPRLGAVALWRQHATSFEALEPIEHGSAVMVGSDGSELVGIRRVTGTLFNRLGISPVVGRALSLDDQDPGAPPVAVLGHAFWQRRFGADPTVTGRTMVLDSTRYTIVGVAPREAERLPGAWRRGHDVFVPLPEPGDARISAFTLAWLRPGVTLAQARSEMAVLDGRLASLDESFTRYATRLYSGRDLAGPRNTRTLLILLGAVSLLLVIAGANVAHLQLGRDLARLPEHAMRSALGARRSQLISQGLLESLLVGLAGGVLGLLLAGPLLRFLVESRPPALDALANVRLEPVAVAVSLGLGLGLALAAGLIPAWQAARAAPAALLHGTWATEHRGGRRLRELLLVAEVSISLVLLVGAGLVARSLWKLGSLPLGLEPDGLVTAAVEVPAWRYPGAETQEAFLRQVSEAVSALPGVLHASRASGVPPQTGITFGALEIAGRTLGEAETESFFASQSVLPDYFLAAGIPILEGRSFDPRGTSGEPNVIIVSRALARRYWPGGGAVGQRIRIGSEGPWQEIVGVAEDVPALGLGELRGALHLYSPHSGRADENVLVVRTTMSADRFELRVRELLRTLDPAVPVQRVASLPALLEESTSTERFSSWLLGGFAGFATLLFAGGLFGVLSQAVALRTREIGVRVALGADPGRVRRLIVRQGLRPALLGVVVGLAGSWFAGRLLAALLHEISPRDGLTFAAAALLTVLVSVVAAWLPARRASRLEPVRALRAD